MTDDRKGNLRSCAVVLTSAGEAHGQVITDAIREAGLVPVTIDGLGGEPGEAAGHVPVERFLLADFSLVDVTNDCTNLIHALGMRDMAKPATTVLISGKGEPVNVAHELIRFGSENDHDLARTITGRLRQLLVGNDHPRYREQTILDLLGEWKSRPVARLKTDIFRDQVPGDPEISALLTQIRKRKRDHATPEILAKELRNIRQKIGPLERANAPSAIDLLLTLRALGDWDGLIEFANDMPRPLCDQIMVREQLAFAYNRRAGKGDRDTALSILASVEKQQGPGSETSSLIGRIHKDLWQDALANNNQSSASGYLSDAIAAYERGFLSDHRDSYPGINLVTLLDIRGTQDALSERERYLPLVRFAVEQRLGQDDVDYWDHATLLELSVLANDPDAAKRHLDDALTHVRESFEPQSTANNLAMIRHARVERREDTTWLDEIIERLKAG